MCVLFCENKLGISFVYLVCPNTGTKFREPYCSNHVIPHRDYSKIYIDMLVYFNKQCAFFS